MQPRACREHFAQLLTEELAGLNELAGLLEHEHKLLVANDVTALESAMHERQSCVARIMRVDEERRSLCRGLGYSTDVPGIEKLLRWCDPQASLAARWAECAARTAQCRELNDRNGVLVRARLKRVQDLLATLIGRGRESNTYGRRGAAVSGSVGAVVTAEA